MENSPGSPPSFHHVTVLQREVVEGLAPRAGGIYVDSTLGGGGHAQALLESAPGITLVGIDHDPAALAAARVRLGPLTAGGANTLHLVHGSFGDLTRHLDHLGITAIDGLLVDLGVSSHQLDTAERGFSFMREGPLDMRMDPTRGPSAADLVNTLPQDELARVLWEFGEERESRRIAAALVMDRRKSPFTTTTQLASLLDRLLRKGGARDRIHPATRTFQALRIAVNGELDQLSALLPAAVEALKVGGRLAVISFHSLEDRMVKQFVRQGAHPCICPPDLPVCGCGRVASLVDLTRKPIEAGDDEVNTNPRSRSARLRIAQRA